MSIAFNNRSFRWFFIVFLILFALLAGRQASADVLSTSTPITTCGEIAAVGTYTLGSDISTSTGPCLVITSGGSADETVINGAGHKITGDIDGDGTNISFKYGPDPGYNFTLKNVTVTGTTSANAANIGDCIYYDDSGSQGGNIVILNSTTTAVVADGTNNGTSTPCDPTEVDGDIGGNGGSISISSSTFSSLSVDGGYSAYEGGNGGSIDISGSDASLGSSTLSLKGGSGESTGPNGTSGALQINFTNFDYEDYIYPALSSLALYGPNNLPGILTFGGNGFPGGIIYFTTDNTTCSGPITSPGVYTLSGDVHGDCTINSNGVTINGAGYTIFGSVDGDNLGAGGQGYSFTLENIAVSGTTTSQGGTSSYDATTSENVYGAGGSITILNATTSSVIAGAYTPDANISGSFGYGTQAGGVNISSSTASFIFVGGVDGLINITNSNIATVSAFGTGQAITVTNSTTTVVSADYSHPGSIALCKFCLYPSGTAGNITITNSITGNISADSYSGSGSVGGNITISGSDLDLSSTTISAAGDTNGTLTINYSDKLNSQNLTLPALKDLTINGPGNRPGDIGAFGGGFFSLDYLINNASQCSLNLASTTYTLANNIVGNCTITANNVTLDGNSHSITGNVIGDGSGGNNGYNFTLDNVTVTGDISSNGSDYSINLFQNIAGSGGAITVEDSTTTNIYSNPVLSCVDTCGSGGSVIVKNSVTGDIDTSANSGFSKRGGQGGQGGTISISTSTTGSLSSNGGSSPYKGGQGGNIFATSSIENVASSSISVNGGDSTECGYGGNAGTISLIDSTYTGAISANPGNNNSELCSDGITLFGSSGSSGSISESGQYTLPQEYISNPIPTPVPTPAPTPAPAAAPAFSGGSSGSFAIPLATSTATVTPVAAIVPAPPETPYQSFQKTATKAATQVAQTVANTAKAVERSPASKPVQATGLLAGLVASVTMADAGAAAPLAAEEAILLPIRLWGLILVGLGIRKRGRPWGTVYDSVTKQPIDPAFVTVKDGNGKVVAESITDLDGRYGFLLPDGTYYLSVKKTNYEFPSQKMSGKTSDELYSDLYFGEPVMVKGGQVLDKNIPLDQKNFDWNEQAKKERNVMLFHSKNERTWAVASSYIYGVGLAISVIDTIAKPTYYNIAILVVYALILAFLEFGLKRKKLGVVFDKITGEPLSYAIIHITTPDHSVVLRSTACDAKGRYYCIIPKGEYCVEIERKNPDGSYTTVHESQQTYSGSGIVNKNFVV